MRFFRDGYDTQIESIPFDIFPAAAGKKSASLCRSIFRTWLNFLLNALKITIVVNRKY